MYRQYENPYTLQAELDRKEEEYAEFLHANEQKMHSLHPNADSLCETAYAMHQEIEELKERVNFAWQDQEYDQCAS